MDDKKFSHISPERMDRYTWHDGEIKILSAEEFAQLKQSKNFIDYCAAKETSAQGDGKE